MHFKPKVLKTFILVLYSLSHVLFHSYYRILLPTFVPLPVFDPAPAQDSVPPLLLFLQTVPRPPEGCLSLPLVQATITLATSDRGVQVLLYTQSPGVRYGAYLSASGMNFLFIGVSRVMGRSPRAQEEGGRPEVDWPKLGGGDRHGVEVETDYLLTSWCTAALAIPYPIMPGVPSRQGWGGT